MSDSVEYNFKIKRVRLWKILVASYSIVIAVILGGFIESLTRGMSFPFNTLATYAGFSGSVVGSVLLYEYSKERILKRVEKVGMLN